MRCLSPAPRNVLQRSLLGCLVAVAHRINDATRESFILPHTNAMAPFHSSLFQWVVAQHGHHARMTTALWHRLPSPLWEWQGLEVSTTGNSGYAPDVRLTRRLPHPSIQDTFFFRFCLMLTNKAIQALRREHTLDSRSAVGRNCHNLSSSP